MVDMKQYLRGYMKGFQDALAECGQDERQLQKEEKAWTVGENTPIKSKAKSHHEVKKANAFNGWTAGQHAQLYKMRVQGGKWSTISKVMGRTKAACQTRYSFIKSGKLKLQG
jgi:hypothetical protein